MRFFGYHQYAGVREKWKEIDDFFVSELELYADYYLTDNGGDQFWNSKPSMYLLSAAIVMADKKKAFVMVQRADCLIVVLFMLCFLLVY